MLVVYIKDALTNIYFRPGRVPQHPVPSHPEGGPPSQAEVSGQTVRLVGVGLSRTVRPILSPNRHTHSSGASLPIPLDPNAITHIV